jgi:hypothetical protein
LRSHVAVPSRRADNDCVVIGQIIDLGDRRRLVEFEIRGFGDVLGHQLGDALDVNMRAVRSGTFGDRVRHRLDMAVAGIIQNEYFGHLNLSGTAEHIWD